MGNQQRSRWPPLLSRHGPQLASSLLVALIAAQVTAPLLTLIKKNKADSTTAASGSGRSTHHGVDVPRIVAAHLFGLGESDPGAQDPDTAPPSTANLVLSGTIAAKDPHQGIAIIGDDGLAKVYGVGESVGAASLRLVYLDRVILDRNGQWETLAMRRPTVGAKSGAGTRKSTTSAVANPTAAHGLGDVIHVGTSILDDAGKLHGFRIYPGEDRTAFIDAGLQWGDLVIAVNGASLEEQDQQSGQTVFDGLRTARSATLTIERKSGTQDISVEASQANSG